MAIFQDKRELNSQERYVGMDKVKGWKKTALAVAGYKDDGTRNTWGHIFGALDPISDATVGRFAANQLTKGTDTGEVIKDTNDDYYKQKYDQFKFSGEVFKLVYGMGGGGNMGGDMSAVMGGDMSSMTGSGTPDMATTGIGDGISQGSTATAGGTEGISTGEINSDAAEEGLDSQAKKIGEGLTDSDLSDLFLSEDKEDEELEEYDWLKTDDNGNEYFLDNNGKRIYSEDLIEAEKAQRGASNQDEVDKQQKQKKEQERAKQVADIGGKIPLIGGVVESGANLYASSKNYLNEEEKESEKYKYKTAGDPGFNLL